MIIGSIVALFLLIGGIALYKTFALYEEKKEFNILQGKVPTFKEKSNDLELAFLLDGKHVSTIPENPEDYAIEFTCDNDEITGTWDSETKNVKVEGTLTKATICTLSFTSIAPTVSITDTSSTTSAITLSFSTKGTITSKSCKCGSTNGSISGNTCTVSGLSSNTTYSCSVTITGTDNYSTSESKNVATSYPCQAGRVVAYGKVLTTPASSLYDCAVSCQQRAGSREWEYCWSVDIYSTSGGTTLYNCYCTL